MRWAHSLDGEIRRTMAGIGLWVDNSARIPDETAVEIPRRPGLIAWARRIGVRSLDSDVERTRSTAGRR